MIKVIKISDRDQNLPHWTKIVYSYITITCTNKKKSPVHVHMTHMVKMDIITGHEENGNLHFTLQIIFHCIFIEKPCSF